MTFLFSSESVSPGHPDKIADQISDAVLDAILAKDPDAHVACETLVKNGLVFLAGEINTSAWVDIDALVREVVRDIGYTEDSYGFDADCIAVINSIGKQSIDIEQGIRHQERAKQGAGDQGLMFGYACGDTDSYMPAPIFYAHKLMQQHRNIFKSGAIPWLAPDAKAQVTMRYEGGVPKEVINVVLSTQHLDNVSMQALKEVVLDEVIRPVIPQDKMAKDVKFFINPAGRFVIGGPVADCGLTGRKIIVDTYGGMARHGGGCFSGKDPSKVDRSAAYMARYIALNIVASGIAKRAEVQLAYAIGLDKPTSIYVNTFGTAKAPDHVIAAAVDDAFDVSPYGIIKTFDLLRPIYQQLATFGHFGREELGLPWEQANRVDVFKELI